MRTHYCGQVDQNLNQKTVELCGWVNKIRNHGKMIFIDLRDREGIVQVFVGDSNPNIFAIAEKIHNEYVLRITGKVRLRPEGLINKEMSTGAIEVEALNIEILNHCDPLPFILEDPNTNEELRLKYRYIELRRPELSNKLLMRSKLAKCIRDYFAENGFVEVETPVLTKSTPEGARDYLVPSRNFPGQFYALPQSPQIFKQLLMASGIDRYYQLVKCFRDEDLRADRQPEFTQLDMEMSFCDESAIQNIIEGMIRRLFKVGLDVDLPAQFPRMSFADAMSKYGSDKPDLRIPLELVDIADLVKNSNFEIFTKSANDPKCRVAALRLPKITTVLSRKQFDEYNEFGKIYGAKGVAYIKVNDRTAGISGLQSSLLKFLSPEEVENILQRLNVQNGDTIFIIADKIKIVNEALGALRVKLGHDHNLVKEGWELLWIINFPMFEQQDDGSWTFAHHPFTAPLTSDPEKLITENGSVNARAYDLVLNGTELGSGSIRIWDLKMQMAVFKMLGFTEEKAKAEFGHLLDAFKYGYPPEGGMALGFDRIVMLLTGAKSLREVIAFPKTQTASCPLTQAPSKVSDAQLQELGINIIKKL